MKLKNSKINSDIPRFTGYRITTDNFNLYIYKTTSIQGIPSIDNLSHIPSRSYETFLVQEDTNTIYTLVYMSSGWEWLKIMNGNEDTLLSFLFPESYLKQEYKDNAYVNINKLLNSINDKHTQDEIKLLIRGISDKLTVGKINEKM